MDLQKLFEKLTPKDWEQLNALGIRVEDDHLVQTGDAELASHEAAWQRCATSAEYFCIDSGYVKTLDNQTKYDCLTGCGRVVAAFSPDGCPHCGAELTLRDAIQPFPTDRYGPRFMIRLLERYPRVAIGKSRRTMATLTACSYALKLLMFRKGTLCVFQSDKEDKANDNVDRVYGMYDRLPRWMKDRRPCNPTKQGQKIEGYFEIPSNYSKLVAIPSGPEQIREMGPSFYFCDEAAFHQNAAQTYGAVKQALEAGCQSLYVSTAAAGFFAALCQDQLEDVAA